MKPRGIVGAMPESKIPQLIFSLSVTNYGSDNLHKKISAFTIDRLSAIFARWINKQAIGTKEDAHANGHPEPIGDRSMRQKNVRIYRNPDRGESVKVAWGEGGENDYSDVDAAATALGCSTEWLEQNLKASFLTSVGISELDLYWDDSMWRSDTAGRNFSIKDRVSLFGEITAVDDEKGEVTIRINGVPVAVTLSNENVVLLARN